MQKWLARETSKWRFSFVLNWTRSDMITTQTTSYWNKIDFSLEEVNKYIRKYYWDNPVWYIEWIIESKLSQMSLFDEEDLKETIDLDKISKEIESITEWLTSIHWRKTTELTVWWETKIFKSRYEKIRRAYKKFWQISNWEWSYTVHFMKNKEVSFRKIVWANKETVNKLILQWIKEDLWIS